MTRTGRRTWARDHGSILVAVVLSLTGCTAAVPRATSGATPSTAPSAPPAATCSATPGADIGDIDGDGIADPVVVPFQPGTGRTPSLDVHNSRAGDQVLTETGLGVAFTHQGFGDHVLVTDITGDGCADVVATAPDEHGGKALVYLIPGSDAGLVAAAVRTISAPAGAGDTFGESVAILKGPNVLAVGASGSRDLAPEGSGVVVLYPLAADGTPGEPTVINEDTPGIPGEVTEQDDNYSDGFGRVLAADGHKLAIGQPSKRVNTAWAGTVTIVSFTGDGLGFTALEVTQDSPGFATSAQEGDGFGSVLAVRDNYVAIGVPDEGEAGAGLVHVLELTSDKAPQVRTVHNLTQDGPGVPGRSELGDAWGSSLALGIGIGCAERTVVVGAPTEKEGRIEGAGSVTVVGIGEPCGERLTQASPAVGGRVEEWDYFGSAVATLARRDGSDRLLISTQQETVGGTKASGWVVELASLPSGEWVGRPLDPITGYDEGALYGKNLGLSSHH